MLAHSHVRDELRPRLESGPEQAAATGGENNNCGQVGQFSAAVSE